MELRETYELHFDGAPEAEFVPLTCYPRELLSKARQMLTERAASGCDVRQFGQTLFAFGQAPAAAVARTPAS